MTHLIVHWKDVVGNSFLEKFIEIAKYIFFMNKQLNSSEDLKRGLNKNFTPEEIDTYISKRDLMRVAGYYQDGRVVRWLGWFNAYVDSGELKFKTTANPDRQYITFSQFLDFKKGFDIDNIEERYYTTRKTVSNLSKEMTMKKIEKEHSRKDLYPKEDPDFIPEIEEAL